MDLSTLCKKVYHRCAATHSQFAFVQGLFHAAGYRLGLTESYAKQLFSGKNFSEDLKKEMRGKNNLDPIATFFSSAIEDTRTQTVLIAFGIPEKNEPNKKALTVALAKQTRAIIEVTDDAEAPDIVGMEYQAAKAAPTIQTSASHLPEPLYHGDDVYVDSGKRYETGSREDIPHTWILQNTGKIRWEKRKLVYRRGPKDRPEAIPSEINIPDTPPGGFVHLSTVFNGRGFDAVTTCIWVMVDEDGADCFPNRSSLFSIIGLQPLHDYQEKFLKDVGVDYKVQDQAFVTDEEIRAFIARFDHVLIHFDIDVLDEHFFHSTYFANPELVGDGAGGGKMTMEKLGKVLKLITENADVVGFTVAEYLPFDEHRLHKMLSGIKLFTE